MPRYKLRIPPKGGYLYMDDGGISPIADTADEAKDIFEEHDGERPDFVHSLIAVGRIVYKRDVENGDAHEDAEPGDTTFDTRSDDGRELRAHEIRIWDKGPPHVSWRMEPLGYDEESLKAENIPVGTTVYHRHRAGKTIARPRRVTPGRVFVLVHFHGWLNAEKVTKACSIGAPSVAVMPSNGWPVRRFRVTVAGEDLGEGTEAEMTALRDRKIREHDERWKAEQRASSCEVGAP